MTSINLIAPELVAAATTAGYSKEQLHWVLWLDSGEEQNLVGEELELYHKLNSIILDCFIANQANRVV